MCRFGFGVVDLKVVRTLIHVSVKHFCFVKKSLRALSRLAESVHYRIVVCLLNKCCKIPGCEPVIQTI